ncbi:MAG: molecular chaperone HtpG [Gammaproteobacteria bacterium]|nr:molecular chaperone HtpG [Gammaproteobacteria bacterium]
MTAETHGFQTEARKLLQLMINSLYSNKEIFLRELISNASDAIDKLRFEALAQPELSEADSDYRILIEFDKDEGTLAVEDNGIGMSRQEVVENLGTIARSGTEEFFANLTGDQQQDSTLIGQFGVGFYSAFIVADEVQVFTQKAGDDQGTSWKSSGEDDFIVDDVDTNRGTRVVLKLKEDALEFADGFRLRNIVRRYSDHIGIPVEMPKGDDEAEDETEVVNSAKALWTRSRSEVSETEYHEFYKHISHDFEDPTTWSHNRVEGKLEYTSLLYVPARAPFDLWNRELPRGLKLYVQRVFIMDEADQFLPLYLRFIRGIVDSNDLPLNVSRELLQQSEHVLSIRNALTKRVLDMLGKMAEEDPDKYGAFWDEFGQVLKEGAGEDATNRDVLLNLLRFNSTADESSDQRVSLAMYKERAKEEQKKIYFVLGENLTTARQSPHLEVFKQQNIEVLLLSDRVDEWLTSFLTEFDGWAFQDIMRGELDLPNVEKPADLDDDPLVQRIQEVLGEKVESVRRSTRLTDSAACLVLGDDDMGQQMRRIMEVTGQSVPDSKPHFEINSDHPLIQRLDAESDEDRFKDMVLILFDQASLADGTALLEPGEYVHRINRLLLNLLE